MIAGVSAELPPSAYEKMQQEAPEHLVMKVLNVRLEREGESQKVEAMAVVEQVLRSATKVKVGDVIRITYLHTPLPEGMVGPKPVPVLKDEAVVPAFLKNEGSAFVPVARAMSFTDFSIPLE